MAREVPDDVGAQVAKLAAGLLEDIDGLAVGMSDAIQSGVALYKAGIVSTDELRRANAVQARFILDTLGREPATSSPESRAMGRKRAAAGVPLTAVMAAYRVAARYLWERLADVATRAGVTAEVSLRAASEMWLVLDTFTQEMTDGYREEMTAQTLSHEEERSALVQALLEGGLGETSLWEAADLLRLPRTGRYVVIAAQVPDIARHALPRIERALGAIRIPSAWRLLHDAEIGIAALTDRRATIDHLATRLAETCTGCVGVSPPYDDLSRTPESLRLARIALHGAFDGQKVTLFDRDPLAVATAGAPDIMRRIAATTLSGPDQISVEERTVLLNTFGVWRDSSGSADKAAQLLHCHPNTVRHRLRRLEERTGRSLTDPRWIAELSLAFETDRRLNHRTLTDGS
jgi:hypothetical protein